jgi:hypothetical protein
MPGTGLIDAIDKPAVIIEEGATWRFDGEVAASGMESPEQRGFRGIEEIVGPARLWLEKGKLHRQDGPAVESKDKQHFYRKGMLHRENGPAQIEEGFEEYWFEGALNREDGPAVIVQDGAVWTDGKDDFNGPLEIWFKTGALHREGGPAVKSPHREQWLIHGNYDRPDGGPAMEIFDDSEVKDLPGKGQFMKGPVKGYYKNGILSRVAGEAGSTWTERDGTVHKGPMEFVFDEDGNVWLGD